VSLAPSEATKLMCTVSKEPSNQIMKRGDARSFQ
jgi:hypothetical protein